METPAESVELGFLRHLHLHLIHDEADSAPRGTVALHHGLHEIGDVGLAGDELKVDVASEARGFLLGWLISVSPFSPGFGDGFIFSLQAAPLGLFGPFLAAWITASVPFPVGVRLWLCWSTPAQCLHYSPVQQPGDETSRVNALGADDDYDVSGLRPLHGLQTQQ